MIDLKDLDLTCPKYYYSSFVIGVLLHISLFRIGEWDLYAPQLLAGAAVFDGVATAAVFRFGNEATFPESARIATLLLASCVCGIFSSILVYRAAFHRLNRFPGPLFARLSNIYPTLLSVKKFQLFEEVKELHAKYGDIVRLGQSRC